jgi:hypothetical protein
MECNRAAAAKPCLGIRNDSAGVLIRPQGARLFLPSRSPPPSLARKRPTVETESMNGARPTIISIAMIPCGQCSWWHVHWGQFLEVKQLVVKVRILKGRPALAEGLHRLSHRRACHPHTLPHENAPCLEGPSAPRPLLENQSRAPGCIAAGRPAIEGY